MMLRLFRLAHASHCWGIPLLPRLLYGINRILFSVVLPPSVKLGRDVVLGYSGLGIVVHARAQIGDRVVIGQNVTIGGKTPHPDVPVIEDDVQIGAGACIIGPVRVGRGAVIGANAVVVHDVPPGAVVAGVPAKILRIAQRDT